MTYAKFIKWLTYKPTMLSDTLKEALKDTLATKTKRPIRLRASGLPSCSLLFLEKMLLDEFETENAMMDYYCSVGTTVHTHLQKWVGKTGKIFGDWKCNSCGHTVKKSLKYNCPKCKTLMEYVELEIDYNIFSGHVDGLLQLPNKKFIVYDFKTSSTRNVYQKKFIPSATHLMQVSAYGAILKRQGYDIDSLSILYVARDNPTQFAEYNIEYTKELHLHTLKFLKMQIKGFKAAIKSKETGDPSTAIKYKMCDTYNTYKEEYEQFFGYEPCHLAKICFNKHSVLDYLNSL